MASVTFESIGIGYSMSNREVDSKFIEIFHPSLSSSISGEIEPAYDELTFDLKDDQGNSHSGKVNASNTISAQWLPTSAWVVEPPFIRRGERVEVFTIGDTGVYYWRELGLDRDLRRLDGIIIAIGATKDEETEFIDFTNSYIIEFSSVSKQFSLTTSKADGEPFAYQLTIDTLEGKAYLADDSGNDLSLESAEAKWILKNSAESYFRLEKDQVEMMTASNAQMLLDGPDASLTNADGTQYSLIGPDLTLSSPLGGKLVINENVVIENASGSKVSLIDDDVTSSSSAGGKSSVTSDVDISGGSVNVSGDSAVLLEGGGGVVDISAGTVNSN